MKFEEYWATDGARFYADTHEERARHAWEASRNYHEMELMHIKSLLINAAPYHMSDWIANDDIVTEIDGMLDEL